MDNLDDAVSNFLNNQYSDHVSSDVNTDEKTTDIDDAEINNDHTTEEDLDHIEGNGEPSNVNHDDEKHTNHDDPEPDDETAEQAEEKPEHKKKDKTAKGRISELVTKKRVLEDQNKKLEQELFDAQKRLKELTENMPPIPDPDAYADDFEYEADRNLAIKMRSEIKEIQMRERIALQTKEELERETFKSVEQQYVQEVNDVIAKDPDFAKNVQENLQHFNRSDDLSFRTLYQNPYKAQITKFILSSPKTAQQCSQMSQSEFLQFVGRMQGKIEALEDVKKGKAVTKVPNPPERIIQDISQRGSRDGKTYDDYLREMGRL